MSEIHFLTRFGVKYFLQFGHWTVTVAVEKNLPQLGHGLPMFIGIVFLPQHDIQKIFLVFDHI